MKKLITLTALSMLAISTPALATSFLTWDEFGCTPKMSFHQGQVYTVNTAKRWQDWQKMFGKDNELIDDGLDGSFDGSFNGGSWAFGIVPVAQADKTALTINGKHPTPIELSLNVYYLFAHAKQGDNTIKINKPFDGTICLGLSS